MNAKQRRVARRARARIMTNDFHGDMFRQPVLFGLDRSGVRRFGPGFAQQFAPTQLTVKTIEDAVRAIMRRSGL